MNKNKSITFGEIALALSNDYDRLFVIDSEDDSYAEYLMEGDNKQLVERSMGSNFYQDVKRDARDQIYPEDQELFLNTFKKENVVEILKNGKAFTLNYRLMVDGEPRHYFLKTIRGTDQKVIIGVRDVEEQWAREFQAEMQIKTYRHIAGALASRYEAIYYINVENNAYTQYSASEEYAKLGTARHGEDFFLDAVEDIKKYIHPDDVKRVLYELERERLLQNLKSSGTITLIYRQLLGEESRYVTLNVVCPKNDRNHIVMGVMNIDEQIKREQSMLAENEVFGEIVTALTKRYEVIYHVNILTNEYSEYCASPGYAQLKVNTKGVDFFADTQKNLNTAVYEEDRPLVRAAMKKEYLLKELDETNKFFLNYRLMLEGRPQFATLIVMRPKDDSDHLIVAVENIDAVKRKEMELEEAIGSAMDMANKDALTGIKNKHAYAKAEMQLDEQIKEGLAEPFAIAVCDINGLKQVNDELGHVAGDEYIKSACMLICEIFQHSPVFRIGGDEFTVILKGRDLENRIVLFESLAHKLAANKREGLVTIACGISEFEPKTDIRVQDVFERADEAMYQNKRNMKGAPVVRAQSEDNTLQFYSLYEQLVSAMTDIKNKDISRIEELLIEISKLFRLSKGVTRVYRNPQEEQSGGGETLCCFDTGREGVEVSSLRVVTKLMSSATLTVYMSPDEEPLSEEEKWRLELVMRTTLSFVSRNRLQDMVEEIAYFDEEGYPNVRSLTSYIVREGRGKGIDRRVAAFHYNLRHFSLINQEFGRKAGNLIMRKHFEDMQALVEKDGYVVRLGGDNFVGICALEQLDKVIDYLTEAVVRVEKLSSVTLSTSVGIYCVPEGGSICSLGDFMGQLIIAYRAAQSGGKNRIVFYDDSLLKSKEKSMRVQQMFPEALRGAEFRPYYQPKVNVMTGKLEGAEALCRWFHDGRMIPPCDFIPMLEETNDICKLDFYMLEHVCRDMRRWLDEGRGIVRVSINFSRKHIMDVDLPINIAKIVDQYGIPHEYIEIELTETTTDVEFSDLKRIAGGLHERGIFTAVDDFGVGFSSLNLLSEIPWNVVKIDRGFLPIEADDENSTRSIMFRHVVSMARQLGLECVAEGVETKRQLEIMRENDCELAQGFYFDRPLCCEDFEKRLMDQSGYMGQC